MPTLGHIFSGRLRGAGAKLAYASRRTHWNPVQPRRVLCDAMHELTKLSARPRPGGIRVIPDRLRRGGVAGPLAGFVYIQMTMPPGMTPEGRGLASWAMLRDRKEGEAQNINGGV